MLRRLNKMEKNFKATLMLNWKTGEIRVLKKKKTTSPPEEEK